MYSIATLTENKSQRELNVLIKISQSIISTLDYEGIMQIISDGMAELLEIETSAMYLVEDDNMLFLGAATPPLDPNMPMGLRKINLEGHTHIKKTLETRKPQILRDTQKVILTPEEKMVVDMRQLRSLIYFPFVHDDVVLGVLILGTCGKVRDFTDSELEFGQTVANQLAVSIKNSLLHKELVNHKDQLEELVKEKTGKLDAAVEELQTINEELSQKNELIKNQNAELTATLDNLQETQTHLIQSEKMASLGILTAGVAHEINNPLNFIAGSLQGLNDHFEDSGEISDRKISLYLSSIQTGLDRITNIVLGLNSFSRNTEHTDEDCDIHFIMDNCLVMLQNQLNHRIEVKKNYTASSHNVQGNVGKLHQVFLNLFTNAIQAIENKGNIEINSRYQADKELIFIEIKDTGHGIPEDILSKISDPFFTTKEPGKGVGLGLYISYNAIEEHKGSISYESTEGKGTIVRITLPTAVKE